MIQDSQGHFHCITHSYDQCGYHSFSTDGWQWSFAPVVDGDTDLCAFTYTVAFEDGSSRQFSRRERPHIVMDGHAPIALTTAVTYRDDASYTLLQPIGQSVDGPAFAARGRTAPPPAAARRVAAWRGDGCHDPGGNTLALSLGARSVTLSRTGLEGVMRYDDGSGNTTSYNHDDFLLEVRGGAGAQPLLLGSAQDSNSHRNCSLMAADCGGVGPRAAFLYRCVQRWQVLVEYELTTSSRDFVIKRLTPCRLAVTLGRGGRRECDTKAKVDVIREILWDGLHRV